MESAEDGEDMLLRCISNRGVTLPANYLDEAGGCTKETEFFLTEGNEYLVYGVAFRDRQVWYYICDDYYTEYPRIHPSPLFTIVDGRLSRHWVIFTTVGHADHFCLISFPEWARDHYFYDRLTNGNEKEVDMFRKMKELVDAENRQ